MARTHHISGNSAQSLYTAEALGDNELMIRKVVVKRSLADRSADKEDIAYWLSRPPGERMEALERLRRHFYGNLPRLQRVARIIQHSKG